VVYYNIFVLILSILVRVQGLVYVLEGLLQIRLLRVEFYELTGRRIAPNVFFGATMFTMIDYVRSWHSQRVYNIALEIDRRNVVKPGWPFNTTDRIAMDILVLCNLSSSDVNAWPELFHLWL
jgi:hypothetical protein